MLSKISRKTDFFDCIGKENKPPAKHNIINLRKHAMYLRDTVQNFLKQI